MLFYYSIIIFNLGMPLYFVFKFSIAPFFQNGTQELIKMSERSTIALNQNGNRNEIENFV